MHIAQLCYRSRAVTARAECATDRDRDLKRLLAKARLRNARIDVTGALLFVDGYYFQTLEGPAHAIDTIFHSVEHDHRHADITVLRHRGVTDRLFPGRPMYFSMVPQPVNAGRPQRWYANIKNPLIIGGVDLTDIFNQLARDAQYRRACADALLI